MWWFPRGEPCNPYCNQYEPHKFNIDTQKWPCLIIFKRSPHFPNHHLHGIHVSFQGCIPKFPPFQNPSLWEMPENSKKTSLVNSPKPPVGVTVFCSWDFVELKIRKSGCLKRSVPYFRTLEVQKKGGVEGEFCWQCFFLKRKNRIWFFQFVSIK